MKCNTYLHHKTQFHYCMTGSFVYIYIYICVYMCVCVLFVVNFDALAQANDIRIERRQVVFLCWRQDSNTSGSLTPNRQQTETLMGSNPAFSRGRLTNRLSYRGSSYKLELDSTAVWHSHLALAIYMFVNFDALAQASDTHTHIYILGCTTSHAV